MTSTITPDDTESLSVTSKEPTHNALPKDHSASAPGKTGWPLVLTHTYVEHRCTRTCQPSRLPPSGELSIRIARRCSLRYPHTHGVYLYMIFAPHKQPMQCKAGVQANGMFGRILEGMLPARTACVDRCGPHDVCSVSVAGLTGGINGVIFLSRCRAWMQRSLAVGNVDFHRW